MMPKRGRALHFREAVCFQDHVYIHRRKSTVFFQRPCIRECIPRGTFTHGVASGIINRLITARLPQEDHVELVGCWRNALLRHPTCTLSVLSRQHEFQLFSDEHYSRIGKNSLIILGVKVDQKQASKMLSGDH